MSAMKIKAPMADAPGKRRAYDPNNLHPLDEEARKYDDNSEGIDWDEILATTEDDFLAGRFAFNSEDYPTHEEAMAGLSRWLWSIYDDVQRDRDAERAAVCPRNATGS